MRPRSLFANEQFPSREEARQITEQVLRSAGADETRVIVGGGARANTRFAENQVSTSGDNYNVTVTVRSAFGRRVGSASSNRLDAESLADVVRRSEALARLAPEDPEYLEELGPQEYLARPETAAKETPSPEQRASAVRAVTDAAEAGGLASTGFIRADVASAAIANSKGLFAYTSGARTAMTTTVRTPDGTGSGWAGATEEDWSGLNARQLGEVASEKAIRSRDPVAIEPGRYTVVLEPTAVANLVQLLVGGAFFGGASGEIAGLTFGGGAGFGGFGSPMNARAADEGRSFFSKPGGENKIGERVVDSRVTIIADPNDPEMPLGVVTIDGEPTRRVVWIENGVVRNLGYDRFWAQQRGAEPTRAPAGFRMLGGDATVADMVRATDRGILVTRFWYIRPVDPRTILYTGLTRDGTFLIENGRVTRAIKNMRWNESPVFLLNNLEMLGRPVRVNADESGDGSNVIVPPIKARDFNFTSLSDAV